MDARELLIAGDRVTLEVLSQVNGAAATAPEVGQAIAAARLAIAREVGAQDEERIERALIDLAAAAVNAVRRIRSTR